LTYAAFLLLFLALPIGALLALRRPAASEWRAVVLVGGAALIYTTPWDNYLVARGVWEYGPDRVLAVIGYVPVEEYAFFLLLPVLVGLLLLRLRGRPDDSPPPPHLRPSMIAGWLIVAVAGVILFAFGPDDALYAGLILAWAPPVLAGLSILGAGHVWAHRRAALMTLAATSAYFWTIDRLAIGLGIWSIDPQYSLGAVLGLPVEEALFFSITSWLCIQGVLMLLPRYSAT
jgi:lycopene cyclase domain-containing protein